MSGWGKDHPSEKVRQLPRCEMRRSLTLPFHRRLIGRFNQSALEVFEEIKRKYPGIPIIPLNQDMTYFYNISGWLSKRLEELEKQKNLPCSLFMNKL